MAILSFQCRPATDKERDHTVHALKAHTEQETGKPVTHEPFGFMGYDGDKLIGSVVGKIYFGWLHIDLFWVDDKYRSQGVGTHLMNGAAELAKQMGLTGIEVWTQSWQAPEFYRKIGYEEFAVIDDFIPGAKRHAFRKHLV